MSLILQKYVNSSIDFAVLATFISGVIILLLGILNLGFIIQFVSAPVTIGFTAAAAFTVISSQIKPLFGLPGNSNDFLGSIINTIEYIDHVQLWDAVLGVSAIVASVLLQVRPNKICFYIEFI